jgi:hypothetical protein
MKKLNFLPVVALLSACALPQPQPQPQVKTGSVPPTLIVKGAPAGSILFVDGLAMGTAAQYDGNPNTLAVLEGSHQVEVRLGNTLVYREKSFASSGERHTVTVTRGVSP